MKIQKKNKILYYIEGLIFSRLPTTKYRRKIAQLKKKLSKSELIEAEKRVLYYNKLSQITKIKEAFTIKNLEKPKTPKSYFFDTFEFAKYFPKTQAINFVFGDVTTIPDCPSVVKSRPISESNQNSILLNLDKARHFVWISQDKDFALKKNTLIGRGAIYGNHKNRIDFYQKYFDHPLCNLGQTNDYEDNAWKKPKISIKEHLDFKFILSLQGNDVATNLKWVMSSNSIAVMPKPTMETWFMEGKLIAGQHYIEIKDDFSNVEEQLQFYIENPDECKKIVENAHLHCTQFLNKKVENITSLLVLEKYFELTEV